MGKHEEASKVSREWMEVLSKDFAVTPKHSEGRGGSALGMFEPEPGKSFCGDVGLRRMKSHRRWWRRPASAHLAGGTRSGSVMDGRSIDGRFVRSIGTRNRWESGGVRSWCSRPGPA